MWRQFTGVLGAASGPLDSPQRGGKPEALAEFHRITATLDARRGETTRAVFPELAPLFAAP
jgi:hypothetical protein